MQCSSRRVRAPCKWVHVDQIKAYTPSNDEQQEALEQAQEALNREDEEFEVERIIGHRGRKVDGTREVLVRWVGYDNPTWEPETGGYIY